MAATGGGPDDRSRPNVLVVGTPGTGKSTLCERLAEASGELRMAHVAISDLAKEKEASEDESEEAEESDEGQGEDEE